LLTREALCCVLLASRCVLVAFSPFFGYWIVLGDNSVRKIPTSTKNGLGSIVLFCVARYPLWSASHVGRGRCCSSALSTTEAARDIVCYTCHGAQQPPLGRYSLPLLKCVAAQRCYSEPFTTCFAWCCHVRCLVVPRAGAKGPVGAISQCDPDYMTMHDNKYYLAKSGSATLGCGGKQVGICSTVLILEVTFLR
jgi:hypothetical protein